MITKTEFLRALESIASRRPGTYDEDTTISFVCSPTGIAPDVLYVFLFECFGESARSLDANDLRDGDLTVGELYDRLVQDQTTAAG